MEKLSRNLEKEIGALPQPESQRRGRRWTLLFVDDSGRVVSIKHFKGWAWTVVTLLSLSLVASGVLLFLLVQTRKENQVLSTTTTHIRKQLKNLHQETDQLMARLVVAEAEIEMDRGADGPSGENDAPATAAAGNTGPSADTGTETDTGGAAAESGGDTVKPEPQPKLVEVEEFQVHYDPQKQLFWGQFNIVNISADAAPVSGRTFVVLKDDADDPAGWIVSPQSEIADKQPAQVRRGQPFSISRFKTVNFKKNKSADPAAYTSAEVFVFGVDRGLITQRQMSIKIDPSPFPEDTE